MNNSLQQVQVWVGRALASVLPRSAATGFVSRVLERNPQTILDGVSPRMNRSPYLDNMPFDLDPNGEVRFEHLSGLFSSTSLDHAVIGMTVRQAAYIFGLVKQMNAQKVLEIGRYKGGTALVIAAAMNGRGEFWSIDNCEKQQRLYGETVRPFDDQLKDVCQRLRLKVHILNGDSRTIEVDTGELDIAFIDGDHTYEGVKSDFERFGTRVRVGGAVLFDDVFDEKLFRTHSDTVGRLVKEIIERGEFKLVKSVNRLAHLQRVRA